MIVDYEEACKTQLQNNIKEFRNNLTKPDTIKKVRNWAKKYGLSPEYIRYKVCTDDIFALFFVKDPIKQGTHEKTAAFILESFPIIYDFRNLDNGGKNAKVINNGIVVSFEESKKSSSNPKTIDFEWKIKTKNGRIITCYASHKYTKASGGSQDNQYKDLQNFMENARLNKELDSLFFAICDGKYYERKNKDTGKSKLEELNEDYYKSNKLIALTINDIFNFIEDFIENN